MNLGELARVMRALGRARALDEYSHPALVFLVPDKSVEGLLFTGEDPAERGREVTDPLSETFTDSMPGRTFEITKESLVVFLKNEKTAIGRAPENELQLAAKSISRVHATIEHDSFGAEIQDAESSMGTAVNGRPILPGRPHKLVDGDRIELGAEVVMKFHTPEGLIDFVELLATVSGDAEDLANRPY